MNPVQCASLIGKPNVTSHASCFGTNQVKVDWNWRTKYNLVTCFYRVKSADWRGLNLTLTGYNSELSNDDFETKRQKLRESHLEINRYFDGISAWRLEDIKNRSVELSKVALEFWPYFGDDRALLNPTVVTGTKPVALWILGQKFDVKSWRDVLVHTMNVIADLVPEKFEQVTREFPRFVGQDRKKFREIKELNNGAFVEVNLSADSIQKFCFQAIETIELTSDDWSVETQ